MWTRNTRSNEAAGSIGLSAVPSFTATLSSRSRCTRSLSSSRTSGTMSSARTRPFAPTSATDIPGLTPANCITSSASPARSRASSVEKVVPTIGATSRCAVGKRGSDGCARQPARKSNTAAVLAALFDILDLDCLAGHALRQGCRHEAVKVAVEHVARAGRGDARPQVLHQLVRLQHVGADLVAPADVSLGRVGGAGLGFALLEFGLVQSGL